MSKNAILEEVERRLRAYPLLRQKIADDKARLDTIRRAQAGKIIRVVSGYRLPPEEAAKEALSGDKPADAPKLEKEIERDEREVVKIDRALTAFQSDPFMPAITGKYFYRYDDDDIAADLKCGKTTLWKERKRILRGIATMLYGSRAPVRK
jgi:hypothetical protein